jgi:hypothetical protein
MSMDLLRPSRVCSSLLAALDASDGRSRSRKRDQTPDTIGLHLRRALLERAVHDDPAPEDFEQWLLEHTAASEVPGATRAIARAVLEDWRLAQQQPSFAAWLAQGAPSEDVTARDAPHRS